MTLDQRYIMMIDNAYYAVNPPVTEERSQGRKLTPLASYVEKLIFNDLSSHNTEKVLKQIRRLHWNDPEEAAFIVKTLGDVWNYKFNNIRYVMFFGKTKCFVKTLGDVPKFRDDGRSKHLEGAVIMWWV